MRELEPDCPPIDSFSITSVSRPSEDAYTAAARPAGPAPTTTTRSRHLRRAPYSPWDAASSAFVGSTSPVLARDDDRQRRSREARLLEQAASLVELLMGHVRTPFRISRLRSSWARDDSAPR